MVRRIDSDPETSADQWKVLQRIADSEFIGDREVLKLELAKASFNVSHVDAIVDQLKERKLIEEKAAAKVEEPGDPLDEMIASCDAPKRIEMPGELYATTKGWSLLKAHGFLPNGANKISRNGDSPSVEH